MANSRSVPVYTEQDFLLAQLRAVEKHDAATGRSITLINRGGTCLGSVSSFEIEGDGVPTGMIVACQGDYTNIVARMLLDATFVLELELE